MTQKFPISILTAPSADNTQLNRFPFASSYPATDYATKPHGMLGHNSPTGATSN